MRITVKLSVKHAVIMFVLGSLVIGSILGHLRIQETNKLLIDVETIQCELVSQTYTNDTHPRLYNIWEYKYANETYTFTDETSQQIGTYVCCVKQYEVYKTLKCPNDKNSLIVFYLICGWVYGIGISCVIWVCLREKTSSQQQYIQTSNTELKSMV